MRILGIDPGSNHTGYGVIDVPRAGPERLVASGVVHLGADDDHGARLLRIHEALTDLVRTHAPDECAVEMPVFGHNPQSLLKLGRAQAAAMLAVLQAGVPVAQYTPAEVKKAVTGSGNAAKENVLRMVTAMLGAAPANEKGGLDASDACAVALCHAAQRRHGATRGTGLGRTGRGGGGTGTAGSSAWSAFVRANPGRVKE